MITEQTPADWRDLEHQVARILEECGFAVERERSLRTVRGKTEIDVYAEETHRGRRSVILCECKHWQARVPQSVVHAFRTTVVDTGANLGYIVGSAGFQSGAFEAAELSNVRLLTWQQFQSEFELQWIEAYLVPHAAKRFATFLRWTELLPPTGGRPLSRSEAERFWGLWRGFQPMVSLLHPFAPRIGSPRNQDRYPKLPLSRVECVGIPEDVLESRGYRELFERLAEHADSAVADLQAAAFVG